MPQCSDLHCWRIWNSYKQCSLLHWTTAKLRVFLFGKVQFNFASKVSYSLKSWCCFKNGRLYKITWIIWLFFCPRFFKFMLHFTGQMRNFTEERLRQSTFVAWPCGCVNWRRPRPDWPPSSATGLTQYLLGARTLKMPHSFIKGYLTWRNIITVVLCLTDIFTPDMFDGKKFSWAGWPLRSCAEIQNKRVPHWVERMF